MFKYPKSHASISRDILESVPIAFAIVYDDFTVDVKARIIANRARVIFRMRLPDYFSAKDQAFIKITINNNYTKLQAFPEDRLVEFETIASINALDNGIDIWFKLIICITPAEDNRTS